jgi:hypothetical protein
MGRQAGLQTKVALPLLPPLLLLLVPAAWSSHHGQVTLPEGVRLQAQLTRQTYSIRKLAATGQQQQQQQL